MRRLFDKSNLGALILAALAAGTCSLPAVAASRAQTASTTAQKSSTTHKKSTGTATHTASHSPAKKTTTSSTAPKATTGATAKPGASATTKSTRGKASTRKKTKKAKGQAAPMPERINEIQQALASKGVYTSTPSGQWDDDTVNAMKKFQSSHGLDPTGKLDALTLQKLGLGSQTAGVAAPNAPPNSINRLRNSHALTEEPQQSTDEPNQH